MGPKRAQEGGAAPHKEGRLGPPSPSWTGVGEAQGVVGRTPPPLSSFSPTWGSQWVCTPPSPFI